MSSQESQSSQESSQYSDSSSSQLSDSTLYPSNSDSDLDESDTDTIPETDTFYDTQNDFKLLGVLLNGSSSNNSQ